MSYSIQTLFVLFTCQLFAQNLIQNPSFENTQRCAELIGNFDNNVAYWSTPTWGTTDIFSTCTKGTVSIPNNYNGMQKQRSGHNYAGFYLHSDNNYREYIQAELSETLKKGVKYKLSFYISLAEKSDLAIKNIDFLLTQTKLNTNISRELSQKQLKKLKVQNYTLYRVETAQFYDNTSSWTLVSKEFIAKGHEQYISIGNFNKNSKTDKRLVSNKNRFNMSYYYIDAIRLERVDLGQQPTALTKKTPLNSEQETIELNKEYTFSTVIFDFNSSKLTHNAKSEIAGIYEFLKLHVDTKIVISGHTDNVGSSEFNQKLSENRANSVSNYFKELGLDLNRITALGYGNTSPIATNDTEEGRTTNRRVSFKIISSN